MERAWTLLQEGGPAMVPLLLCSVLSLAVCLERVWALRRGRVLQPALIDLVRNYQAGSDPELSRSICERNPGAFATVIRVIVSEPPPDREMATEHVQFAGKRAVKQLDRGLVVLEIIAGISPLLGLLGTVLGMFNTFQVIARQGLGDPGALSGGISEALVTTIFGLGIAIPTVVAHSYFSKRVDDLVLEIEDYGTALLQRLYPDGRKLAQQAGTGKA